jgi:nucleotide-binding universal stress UspA family protein
MTAITEVPTASLAAAPEAPPAPPIVAAVDASPASRAAVDEAIILAAELDLSLVFVYVRRGPAGFFGRPI